MHALLLAAALACPPTWDYQHQDKWDGLCVEGQAQSPIVIANAARSKDLPPLKFKYAPFTGHVLNTSRATEVEIPEEVSERLQQGTATYELVQFHFHFPAEHIDGKVTHAGELHLVHRDPVTKKLHVVAIWIDKSAKPNPALASIVQLATGLAACDTSSKSAMISPGALIPVTTAYQTYTGSFTIPPCTEGVTFIILGKPIVASEEQIAVLSRGEVNAREVQQTGERTVSSRN